MTSPFGPALRFLRVGAVSTLVVCSFATTPAQQLNENCVVSVLNRTVQVNPDGSWVLPNVPANFGPVRARATCVINGKTVSGESELFTLPANGVVNLPPIILFGTTTPIPSKLTVTAPGELKQVGATLQLVTTAQYSDATEKDVTLASTGTQYTVTNSEIATVSLDGLVTALKSGTVLVQSTHEGASGMVSIRVALSGTDTDGDGIPDDAELTLGLNPANPVDASEDFDRDDLTNLQEYNLGTGLRDADSDDDALTDGKEVTIYGTSPLLADTDGELIPDGVEVETGTNPLDPNNYDLKAATASSVVSPPSFLLTTSVLFPNASQLLNWKVSLIDNKTTLDLTADPRTNYGSSDLTICNFGAQKGRVFAGSPGSCTITITNNTLTVPVSGAVKPFTPTALSFIDVPGFANNVDISGDYAYIAAGAAGLQIVNVSNRLAPQIVASKALPGNANDVVVVDNRAFVAAGNAGLQIVNVVNPLAPAVEGSAATEGVAWDVVVKGTRAYIASGTSGLAIVDVSSPGTPVFLGSLPLSGTAKGVDVDPVREIAVVALGGTGLAVIDVASPAAPTLKGSLGGGDVRDVVLSGNFAFLADYSRSFTSVDVSNPAMPVLKASTPSSTGGLLQDVAVSGALGTGADVLFVNGVPLIDVTNAASPQPRMILSFENYRDDNGTGIALDSRHVYLTAEAGAITENGVNGTTRLYIGQYLNIQDDFGVPPSIQITSPESGTEVIKGSTVTVIADALDDVAVASVTFLVDGKPTYSTATEPYQYSFAVPTIGNTVALAATAIDYGGNLASADIVTLNLVPDPLTTVTGRVVDAAMAPVSGATVTVLGVNSTTTDASGLFAISGVPTVRGLISATAEAVLNGKRVRGRSAPTSPVPAGTTDVGDIVVLSLPTALLVSARSGTEGVLEFNPDTGAFVRVLIPPGFGGINSPDGIVTDADGNVYVASNYDDPQGASVLKYDGVTGAFLSTFVPLGTARNITGITFGPNGNLYVSDFLARNVKEYDASTGTLVRVFAALTGGRCCAQKLAFGPNGNLYVATQQDVQEFNGSTGTFVKAFANGGTYGLAFGPDGNLYVGEPTLRRVLRYNPDTGVLIGVFVPPSSGGLASPAGLAFGPDGNLYVVDRTNDEILRYSGTSGAFIDAFVSPGSGGLQDPINLVFGGRTR